MVICAQDWKLPRALVVVNLIAIHRKNHTGSLSACRAVCGISCLLNQPWAVLKDTITNTIATVGGMVSDGAKSSFAAKISTVIRPSLPGMKMGVRDRAFRLGEGLVKENVEEPISNIGRMCRDGMRSKDNEILNIMLGS